MKKLVFISLLFISFILSAQKNNFDIDSTILFKKYTDVCFPTTHNSFNYLIGPKQYIYPNQRFDIPRQLKDGIRAFMIDIHDDDKLLPLNKNEVYVFHEMAILGKQKLASILDYFSAFLKENPNEIITIIFDCDVSDSKKVTEVFESSQLSSFLYHHQDSIGWQSLDKMIKTNQRCVVFTHCNSYSDWYLHQNDYCFENDYNNHSFEDYKGKIIRGDTSKPLFIMNHFIYHIFNRKVINATTNSYSNLKFHLATCKEKTGKLPNFLTVDWYDEGDLFKVVNDINHGLIK